MLLAGVLLDTSRNSWDFASYLRELAHRGVLADYLPEIEVCYGFEQPTKYHRYDVFEHTLAALCQIGNSIVYLNKLGISVNTSEYTFLMRVGLLFHDIGKPYCFKLTAGTFHGHAKESESIAKPILKRLNLYNGIYNDKLLTLIREHMSLIGTFNASNTAVNKCMNKIGVDIMPFIIGITYCDLVGTGVPSVIQEDIGNLTKIVGQMATLSQAKSKSPKAICVDGDDMIKIGFKGVEIGVILKGLSERVYMATLANDREVLLEFATRYYNNHKIV